MIKDLKDNGYELEAETKDYKIYHNKKIEQVVILMDKFDNVEEENYIDELIEENEKFKYNKKTMAFIGEIEEEDREEILNDDLFFIKIEGFRSELIPRHTNKMVEFRPVEQHTENGLFFNPYYSLTTNLINLLKEINTGVNRTIIYKYPKPMLMSMAYLKYFLSNKVNVNYIKEEEK